MAAKKTSKAASKPVALPAVVEENNEIHLALAEAFNEQDKRIQLAICKAECAMEEVACALYSISEKKLYIEGGYKSAADYAMDRYGIARSTVSECVNTFKTFGDPETGEIRSEYAKYTFTQLKLMRKLPTEEWPSISADTSTRDIQRRINEIREENSIEVKGEEINDYDVDNNGAGVRDSGDAVRSEGSGDSATEKNGTEHGDISGDAGNVPTDGTGSAGSAGASRPELTLRVGSTYIKTTPADMIKQALVKAFNEGKDVRVLFIDDINVNDFI